MKIYALWYWIRVARGTRIPRSYPNRELMFIRKSVKNHNICSFSR